MLTFITIHFSPVVTACTAYVVKSTSPDTENHDKNGYAKLYDDKNIFMTNVDNNYSDMTYTNKHKNTEFSMRDINE